MVMMELDLLANHLGQKEVVPMLLRDVQQASSTVD
jgi:hypothetical protein